MVARPGYVDSIVRMSDRIPAERSLATRLRTDLIETLGDDAPEVLHFWIEGGLSVGIILNAGVVASSADE